MKQLWIAFCLACFACGKADNEAGKFAEIYLSLEKSMEVIDNSNAGASWSLQRRMEEIVEETRQPEMFPELIRNMEKAKDLRNKTTQTISVIEKVKKSILFKAGYEGFMPTQISDLKDIATPQETKLLMIGQNKNGKAYNIAQVLDAYVDFLNQEFVKKGFLPTLSPFEKLTKNKENKDFANYYFNNTHSLFVLSTLTEKQINVLELEIKCLKSLFNDDVVKPKFNEITPWASAESNQVEEGKDYVAYMSLSRTSSKIGARMTLNGKSIRVNSNGFGEIRFKATGKGKQKWQGSITMKHKGRDTTFYMEREYEVIAPCAK